MWPAAGRGGQSESPFSRPASEGRAGRHAPGGRGRTEGRGLVGHAPPPRQAPPRCGEDGGGAERWERGAAAAAGRDPRRSAVSGAGGLGQPRFGYTRPDPRPSFPARTRFPAHPPSPVPPSGLTGGPRALARCRAGSGPAVNASPGGTKVRPAAGPRGGGGGGGAMTLPSLPGGNPAASGPSVLPGVTGGAGPVLWGSVSAPPWRG